MKGHGITPIDVQRFLGGIKYPATRLSLVERARSKGADKEIIGLLDKLPDRIIHSPADLSHEVAVLLSGEMG